MTRDHLLVLLVGLLSGFILGYVAHEVMASRQPIPAFAAAAQQQAMMPQGAAQQAAGPQAAGPQGPAGMAEVQQLAAYVASNPDDLDAVRKLANLNYDIANWGRAVELYSSYLEKRPDDVDVATDLGAALRHQGRPDDALELFEKVLQRRPDHWQSLYNEILVLAFDMSRLDDAWNKVQELQKLQPGNPDVQRLADEIERRRAAAS